MTNWRNNGAIFHLALDAHWHHYKVTGDATCNNLQVCIDHGTFKPLSRPEDRRTCCQTGIYGSRNDTNEAGDVYRIGNFQLIKKPHPNLHTPTLTLSWSLAGARRQMQFVQQSQPNIRRINYG